MKRQMNKHIKCIFACILMTAALQVMFTGCKNNTENNKVNDTSKDEYNDASYERSGIGKTLNVPKGCHTDIDVGDAVMESIEISDDEIEVPDADRLYEVYFEPDVIDAEGKKEIAETLFEKDKGIYVYDSTNQRKRDIEESLKNLEETQKYLDEMGEAELSIMLESDISSLKKQLLTAPDEYKKADTYEEIEYIGEKNGTEYRLGIYSGSGEELISGSNLRYGIRKNFVKLRPYQGADSVSLKKKSENTNMDNKDEYSLEYSDNVARSFMAQFGISDIVSDEGSDLEWEYYDCVGNVVHVDVAGYVFKYKKSIGNVPLYNATVGNVDNLLECKTPVYIPVENYTIRVYNGEVIWANWNRTVGKIIRTDEDIELLQYEDIIETVKNEAHKYYEKYPTKYNKIKFNDVRLNYYLTCDASGEFKYVPAWIFSEYDEMEGYNNSEQPTQLLVVNAVDGSIIDIPEEAKFMEGNTE